MAWAVTLQLSLGKRPWLWVGDAVGVPLVAAAERLSAARAFIERFPAATENFDRRRNSRRGG